MEFQEILAFIMVLMVLFFIIAAVVNISGILGIVFGCISADKSKKYVTMRGNLDFRQVKSYATASKVFFIINCIVLGLLAATLILMTIESGVSDVQYGCGYIEDDFDLADFISGFVGSATVPIASVVVGIISIQKFKEANELKAELDSKGLVAYPLPQNPYYNTAYRYPYQNQYYNNGQYRNPYQNQYYNGQYPNNRGYYQYPNQGYPQQNQYNQYNNTANQQNVVYAAPAASETVGTSGGKKCPYCGAENNGEYKFCTHCGKEID